jgi:aldehyde:ferredoxin oxidoreductase
MGGGYMGRILNVDLSSGQIHEEKISDETYQRFLSAAGLGAKILFDRIPKGADPMGPENVLGFLSGLLTGTGALFTGRWMVVGKSPLTGGYGEANCGGTFSPAMKRCGFDGIFVKGISKRPVYLLVTDGKAELKDATRVWGKDATEAERLLQEDNGGKRARVALIGPAGENRCLISGVCHDRGRLAARSGLGAVMGAKKLKAVVLLGDQKIPVVDPHKINVLNETFLAWLKEGPGLEKRFTAGLFSWFGKFLRVAPIGIAQTGALAKVVLRKYGTMGGTVFSAESGDSPVKNWKGSGHHDFPIDTHSGKLDPDKILGYQYRKYHCFSCPLGCGGLLKVTTGRYSLEESHKPEYETCCAFGALILNNDLEALLMINEMLNRAGMDTISAGSTVAFTMECYENGILSRKDLGGIDLKWGNVEGVIALLNKMINREGIGDVLADGVKKAAERIGKGSEKYAVHAGGQELPMHDPRFDPGLGVAYELEPTPGRHTNVGYQWSELFALHKVFPELPKPPPFYMAKHKYDVRGKMRIQAAGSKYSQMANGLGVCLFGTYMSAELPLYDYTNAATGWSLTPREYLRIGERIQNIRQAFNGREGLQPIKDFRMNPRAAGEPPLTYGPLKGISLPRDRLNRDFCREMGWDEKTGVPTRERLESLGLEEVAETLYGKKVD